MLKLFKFLSRSPDSGGKLRELSAKTDSLEKLLYELSGKIGELESKIRSSEVIARDIGNNIAAGLSLRYNPRPAGEMATSRTCASCIFEDSKNRPGQFCPEGCTPLNPVHYTMMENSAARREVVKDKEPPKKSGYEKPLIEPEYCGVKEAIKLCGGVIGRTKMYGLLREGKIRSIMLNTGNQYGRRVISLKHLRQLIGKKIL